MRQLTQLLKLSIPAVAVAALGVGCASDHVGGRPGEDFLPEGETAAVTRLAEQQIAAGCRTDATLRAYHFDHMSLNSLGRQKLDFFLSDDDKNGQYVIYVDVPTGENEESEAGERNDSVTRYLLSRGLTEAMFRLEAGYNPNNTMSVASAEAAKAAGPAPAAPAGSAGGAGYGASGSMSAK